MALTSGSFLPGVVVPDSDNDSDKYGRGRTPPRQEGAASSRNLNPIDAEGVSETEFWLCQATGAADRV